MLEAHPSRRTILGSAVALGVPSIAAGAQRPQTATDVMGRRDGRGLKAPRSWLRLENVGRTRTTGDTLFRATHHIG